jgi:predicted SAM-dependent methyltransferase
MRSTLARAGIALAAFALFLLLRVDIADRIWERLVFQARKLRSPSIVESYLSGTKVRKLQLGAGLNARPGWLNTDIELSDRVAYLNVAERFPLPDNSIRYIHSEELFEHIPYEQGLVMLTESYRVLEPGGTMRLATPNLLRFTAMLHEQKSKQVEDFIKTTLAWHGWEPTSDPASLILNREMRDFGHQFLYTPDVLRARLRQAGFEKIQQREVSQSEDPELRNLEHRARWLIKDANAYQSMVFEATK